MATVVDDSQVKAMQDYFREGEVRAKALGNRGPIRFTANGDLHPDILDAYDRYGFYVFENVIAPAELSELQEAYHGLVERLPAEAGSQVDRSGRPALGTEQSGHAVSWVKPLAGPSGGTAAEKKSGEQFTQRYPVKMFEPKPAAHLPDKVAASIFAPLQYSDAFLRLYGHPSLLSVAGG